MNTEQKPADEHEAAASSTATDGQTDGAGAAPATLEERLAAAETLASQHYDAFLRARAEGENIRRRSQDEVAKAHKFAVEGFAGELLAVKDSLEAALASPEGSVEAMRAGVDLTLRQLKAAFDKGGVREIDPTGERFDPNRHQAISAVPSEQEPNTVVNVLQKGYLIAERTLRPALVTVARKPD
jgi:molecular chaperone GrpE